MRLRDLTRRTGPIDPRHAAYLLLHLVLFLTGIIFVQFGGPLWISCGSSLVAAALTGWVVFVYVLLSQRTSRRLEILSRFGIATAFDRRSMQIKEEYGKRLKESRRNIDILGFGQRALRQDFGNQFKEWSQRGASVRILLIDPEYPSKTKPFANQRDLEELNNPGTICGDVRDFIKSSKELMRSAGDTFSIRLYTCLPTVNIFRIDSELFWGPYLIGEQSRNLPTFLVQQGVLFDFLTTHFDRIWNDERFSRPVPEEWLGN